MIDTWLHPAYVVTHDEKDVRFLRTHPATLLAGERTWIRKDAQDFRLLRLTCLRIADCTPVAEQAGECK